jgi:hypothetical protein
MRTNGRINVAIVGLGFGAEFIPIYQKHPRADIHAICRRNKAELDKIGDVFGIGKRYTDYGELLKDPEIDFVHINSPIPDHGSMSIAAPSCICLISQWSFDKPNFWNFTTSLGTASFEEKSCGCGLF